MKDELLISDLDDTLCDMGGFFRDVPNFLRRQSAQRECIIATTADAMVEREIAAIKESIKGFYPRQVVGRGYEYLVDDEGKLFHKAELEDDFGEMGDFVKYLNPFLEGYEVKDINLVTLLHSQKTGRKFQKTVFLGDDNDITYSPSAPLIPSVHVRDPDWAMRGGVEGMIEKLFKGDPEDLFDNMYSAGKSVADRILPREEGGKVKRYREVKLANCVEMEIEGFRCRMIGLINGRRARAIQEI